MLLDKSKQLKETVYAAKEILSHHDDIRHALNLAMGYIRIIAYMNTCKLKEKMTDTYQETEKLYETLLEKAEKEAEKLSEKEKKLILKVIEYLRHPKYRYLVAIMTKQEKETDYTFT